MKTKFITLLLFVVGLTAQSQTTAIPDAGFEQVLINLGIDSDGTINGQILTADALQVTHLDITSSSPNSFIQDVTGIEAFVNIDTLKINFTEISSLNLSTLSQLKYLDVNDNMLTSLDVSNNILLEYLRMDSVGDVYPINHISEIDLSNNPNINHLEASGTDLVNLKNGNNNENMKIWVGCPHCWEDPVTYIWNSVCIIVNDAVTAQNMGYPYSNWLIGDNNINLSFIDDYSQCSASTPSFSQLAVKMYPNPAKDIVYFDLEDTIQIYKAELIDMNGKTVRTDKNVTRNFSVQGLSKGTYVVRLSTNKGVSSSKLVIE